jgi:hypothetical protein
MSSTADDKFSKITDEQWYKVSNAYEPQQRSYVEEQLEFMGSVKISFPDETTMYWEDRIAERYEELADSFGEVDEYLKWFDDGSIRVFVELENETLFSVYGKEQDDRNQSRAGLSSFLDTLKG